MRKNTSSLAEEAYPTVESASKVRSPKASASLGFAMGGGERGAQAGGAPIFGILNHKPEHPTLGLVGFGGVDLWLRPRICRTSGIRGPVGTEGIAKKAL